MKKERNGLMQRSAYKGGKVKKNFFKGKILKKYI